VIAGSVQDGAYSSGASPRLRRRRSFGTFSRSEARLKDLERKWYHQEGSYCQDCREMSVDAFWRPSLSRKSRPGSFSSSSKY